MIEKTDRDLHEALRLAVLAILQTNSAAQARLTPEQNAEVHRKLDDGSGRIALFVSTDGHQAHVELALIDAGVQSVFSQQMLKLDGPLAAAAAPAGSTKLIDRGALN